MLYPGTRVTHNQFPPVIGTVVGSQDFFGGKKKVAVLNDATGTLFYDFEDTWEVIQQGVTPSFEYNGYEGGHRSGPETEIIDVEYQVLDD